MLAGVALAGATGVVALSGCGHTPRAAAMRVERGDLVVVAHTLRELEGPVHEEVAAARIAWPAVAGGLPAAVPRSTQAQISTAARRAASIALPRYLDVEGALTGPAAQLSGLIKGYARLSQRGWSFIATAAKAGNGKFGPARLAGAAFLRANSGLYVYCVYDGHYDVSLLGAKLQDAYRKLGGPQAFGPALTNAEIDALARSYSIDATRLVPHPSSRVHA